MKHKAFAAIVIGILFYVFIGAMVYDQEKNYIKYKNRIIDLEYQKKELENQNNKLINHIEILNNRIVILSVRSNKEEKSR